jgi:hypothetical protein
MGGLAEDGLLQQAVWKFDIRDISSEVSVNATVHPV